MRTTSCQQPISLLPETLHLVSVPTLTSQLAPTVPNYCRACQPESVFLVWVPALTEILSPKHLSACLCSSSRLTSVSFKARNMLALRDVHQFWLPLCLFNVTEVQIWGWFHAIKTVYNIFVRELYQNIYLLREKLKRLVHSCFPVTSDYRALRLKKSFSKKAWINLTHQQNVVLCIL